MNKVTLCDQKVIFGDNGLGGETGFAEMPAILSLPPTHREQGIPAPGSAARLFRAAEAPPTGPTQQRAGDWPSNGAPISSAPAPPSPGTGAPRRPASQSFLDVLLGG